MKAHQADATLNQVDRAFYYAIRLVAKMEESSAPDGLIYVPEVVVWAVERLKPGLIVPLRDNGELDDLINLLRLYGSLRPVAESIRLRTFFAACEECGILGEDSGYLTPEDMLYALRSGDWACDDLAARDSIERALVRVMQRSGDTDSSSQTHSIVRNWLSEARQRNALTAPDLHASDALDPQLSPVLSEALNHARHELTLCDSGSDSQFWSRIYTSVLGDWLQTDMPEVAREILETELVSEYFGSLWAYVCQMRRVERVWNGLSYPLRTLLLRARDEDAADRLIAQVVRAHGMDESEVSAWTTRIWNMVKRRGLYEGPNFNEPHLSNESNAVIDSIRRDSNSFSTCYVIDSDELPSNLRGLTDERRTLVVRLPEPWLQVENALASETALECFFSTHAGTGHVRLELAVSRAFWCDYHHLWPIMFGFRRSVPVLYVFDKKNIFVSHRFDHFTALHQVAQTPHKHRLSITIDDGEWKQDVFASRLPIELPNGTRIKPSLLTSLLDRTTHIDRCGLREAYLKKNPDAALSPEERRIRSRLGSSEQVQTN